MNRPYYLVNAKTLCHPVARGILDAPLRRSFSVNIVLRVLM